jgi:hypothetical protein
MKAVKVLEVKRSVLTPEQVDEFAVKLANIDAMSAEVDKIKKRLRKEVGPGGFLDGIAFRIEVSEEVPRYGKVDYRAELLKYMKKSGVDNPGKLLRRMERAAGEEVVDYTTARVTVVPNPTYKPQAG